MKKKTDQTEYNPLVDFINRILIIYSHLPNKRAGVISGHFQENLGCQMEISR